MSFIRIERNWMCMGLHPRAVLMMGLLYDRMQLSVVNGWRDDRGYYVLYTLPALADDLCIKKRQAMKLLAEIEERGLIHVEKVQGCPNKIYLISAGEDSGEAAPDPQEQAQPEHNRTVNNSTVVAIATLEGVSLTDAEIEKILKKYEKNAKNIKNSVAYLRAMIRNSVVNQPETRIKPAKNPQIPVKTRDTTYDLDLYEQSNAIFDEWDTLFPAEQNQLEGE